MPPKRKFSDFNTDVFAFNEQYNLDFSFEKFQEGVLRLNNVRGFLGQSRSNSLSNDDSIYRGTFEKLYKQAINNVIDKKIAPFDYSALLDDFDKLMDNYRDVCKDTKKPMPSKRGGWTLESDIIKSAQKKLNEVNNDKQANVEERYKNGEIRIRDMRAYAEKLDAGKEESVEKLSTLLNYANALENTNKNRPTWWRAIHWIRNRAEKKYAEQIRNTAKKLLGNKVADAEAILKQQDAPKLKNDMKDLLDQTVAKEKNPENAKNLQAKPTTKAEPTTKVESTTNKDIVQQENTNVVSESKPEKDDLKPEPIKVDINNVHPENDKSLADLTATERIKRLQSTTGFKKDMLKEIMSCLKDSPLSENDKLSRAMSKIYNELIEYSEDVICDTYDDSVKNEESLREIDNSMQFLAKAMFENAYDSLEGFKLPAEKKLLAAQKLANLFLAKATPAGFYPEKFGKYANNYAIKNRDDIISKMQRDTEHTINEALYGKIIDDTMNALNSREKYTVEYDNVKISENTDSSQPYYNTIDFISLDLDKIPENENPNISLNK